MLRLTRLLLVSLPHARRGRRVAQELPVDLELVLAVDVSGSIDAEEARQQREGYVAAHRRSGGDQAIAPASTAGSPSTYLEWASGDYQRLVLGLDADRGRGQRAGVRRPARARARGGRRAGPRSAPRIDAAVPLFDGNGYAGDRRVIDVSGDGPNNRGRPVARRARRCGGAGHRHQRPADPQRPAAAVRPADADGAGPGPLLSENVVGGPGSFVVPAKDFTDFRAAILSKLIREIAADGGAPVLSLRASRSCRVTLTAAEFEALAAEGVPYVGQLGCRVERFEPG